MPARPDNKSSALSPNRKLIKIKKREHQSGTATNKKEKVIPVTGLPPKLKKPRRNKVPVVKMDNETQTLPCKATQTQDKLLQIREEQFFDLLKERKAAALEGASEMDNEGPFVNLDIRIPELTIADIYAYAEKHNCEIRMS